MLHFVDTETTGLDPHYHEMVSIAIITEFGDGRIDRWYTKLRPRHIERAHPKALQVNGYTEEDWEDAPYFDEVFPIVQDKLRIYHLMNVNWYLI